MATFPFLSLASSRDSDEVNRFSRREFLGLSAAGLTSSALLPVERALGAEPSIVQVPAVIGFVGRFAAAVGSAVVADVVSDYLRAQPNSWLIHQIASVNERMRRGHFNNFTRSRVFNRTGRIFYPVIHRDGFNACVAFHNAQRPDPAVPMVEGPTVVGLTLAAEEVARHTSRQNARRIFHPERSIEAGTGAFETTYGAPDRYQAEGGGYVAMNYRNDGPGRGTVAVLAEGPINRGEWGTLFNRQYSIQYA